MTFLKKILLLDYETRATALVRGALERTGRYLIREEHDRRLAVSAARWFQPDLIVFELAQPQAVVAAQPFRSDPGLRETPMVFVSGDVSNENRVVSGGWLSGYSFLANPVAVEELMRYIAELLELPGTAR